MGYYINLQSQLSLFYLEEILDQIKKQVELLEFRNKLVLIYKKYRILISGIA